MRDTYTLLYVHIVWATWDRLPLLTEQVKRVAYICIRRECEDEKATVIALGGVDDHVHLLLLMPPTVCVAALVKQIKGASSRLISQQAIGETPFKWQGSYGAFTVSPWDVPKVKGYIARQEQHHRDGTAKTSLEHVEQPAPA